MVSLFPPSYLRCIPRSFSRHISRDNFLTKLRIGRVFSEFVLTFQQHTVSQGKLSTQEVMYKYLATLENLAPRFGTETFPVTRLVLKEDGDSSGTYLSDSRVQGDAEENGDVEATCEVMISGTRGIQWRNILAQKVCVLLRERVKMRFCTSASFDEFCVSALVS